MKEVCYKVVDGAKKRFAVVEYVNDKSRVMDEWDYLPAAVMSACE